ncbi:MAG: hypothetical protein DMG12_08155 [Acidobacteria bacterium]|nr:MAG: hypothetical protein DMG12_08155 [Acidobacteriota bacterium]
MRNPPAALRRFLEPYEPMISRLFFASRKVVLEEAPEATELIYDAYNAVTAAYSFTNRLKEAFCHVAAYPKYVNVGFFRGAGLPDPEHLLAGTGTNIRHIRIATIENLQRPGMQNLVRAAVQQARHLSPPADGTPKSIVKAVYPKKRRPSSVPRSKPRK